MDDIDDGFALLYGVSGIARQVFVYRRTATGWSHQQTLTPPSGAEFDSFGQEIELQGRIPKRSDGNWSLAAVLTAEPPAGGSWEGASAIVL
jgi:hypothetical protein